MHILHGQVSCLHHATVHMHRLVCMQCIHADATTTCTCRGTKIITPLALQSAECALLLGQLTLHLLT